MKLSIVIPTYNEAENIQKLIPEIFKVLDEAKLKGEVLIVDDNSPDGTGKVAKSLGKKYKVRLLHRKQKEGLGAAYIAGFKQVLKGDSDIIFEMDADLSHKPEYIPAFVKKIEEGADLVIGSRYAKGGGRKDYPLHRTLISHGANYLIRLITQLPVTDVTTGYRAYRRSALESLDLDEIESRGFEFQLEMLYKLHKQWFRIDKVPIIFTSREVGESKLSFKDVQRFFIRGFQLRFFS